MAPNDKPEIIERVQVRGDLSIETNDLLPPYYSVLLREGLVIELENKVLVALPAYSWIYLASTEFGADMRTAVKEAIAEAKYEEEQRIAHMTPAERQAWLDAFIPF